MKLLMAENWIIEGYDESSKSWKFLNQNKEDWERCEVPQAKFVDRKKQIVRLLSKDGSILERPMRVTGRLSTK